MIEVKNLTKKYGTFTALKDLNFTFEKGHVYGLLGPNGAGKSTTMNIMTGCLAASGGSVSINGFDIYEDAVSAKKCIGYLPEIPPLYSDMTPVEYLYFVGRAKKIPKNKLEEEVEKAIKKTGVTDVAERLIKNLSKGFKQRVGIAQAILGDPEIIILDEPTVGLDPTQLIEIRDLIKELGKEHVVILSSHIMGEITAVCDYIIMIAHGRIVAKGTLEELEGSKDSATVTVNSRGNAEDIKAELEKIPGVSYCRVSETGHCIKSVIEAEKGYDLREDIFNAFVKASAPILEMTSSSVGLEDLFIKITSMPVPEEQSEERSRKSKKEKTAADYDPLGKAYLGNTEENETCDNVINEDYAPLFSNDENDYASNSTTTDDFSENIKIENTSDEKSPVDTVDSPKSTEDGGDMQ